MKNLLLMYIALVPMLLSAFHREEIVINKTYEIGEPQEFLLNIRNVNGGVEVEGYDGTQVILELVIQITSNDLLEIEKGKRELELGEYRYDDELILTMKAPFVRDYIENGRVRGMQIQRDEKDYRFKYTFRVKVPRNINVDASTVNKGDIRIEQVSGRLATRNVNGDIMVRNAREIEEASTVNGDIDVSFFANPEKNGKFNTINGDITLELKRDLSAQILAKSMQGEFFSAFDFTYMPPIVEVNESRRRNATEYKIGSSTQIQIGEGEGPDLRFETLTGNVYLKRI